MLRAERSARPLAVHEPLDELGDWRRREVSPRFFALLCSMYNVFSKRSEPPPEPGLSRVGLRAGRRQTGVRRRRAEAHLSLQLLRN